jgi:hypothetical protein
VARSLGIAFAATPDLVEAAWPIARPVPDGERRHSPNSAFRPGLVAPEGASRFDQILAMLGRSPVWDPVSRKV